MYPGLLAFHNPRGTSTSAYPRSNTNRNKPHVFDADDAIAFNFWLKKNTCIHINA